MNFHNLRGLLIKADYLFAEFFISIRSRSVAEIRFGTLLSAITMSFAKPSTSFLSLSWEIRNKTCHFVLVAKGVVSSFKSIIFGSDLGLLECYLRLVPQILCVCRTIATETLPMLHGKNGSPSLPHAGLESNGATDSYRGLKSKC